LCLPCLLQVIVLLTYNRSGKTAPVFHPEFGRFMLETTPGKPWGIDLKDLLDVEPDMKWR
jgi:glutamate--cysteine ligase catalytic subunit